MNPIELPAAGLHYGIPFEVYQKWPAANFSKIKPIQQTASKCKYEIDHPKVPTPAMILGTALHMATLEPARFEGSIYICPPCDRRTKEGKEAYEQHARAAGAKLLIRQGSSDDEEKMGAVEALRGMAAAIHSMKSAAPFLQGQGQNEVSALWKDEETGLWCKARFDRFLTSFQGKDLDVVVELKSAKSASDWLWAKEVDSRAYDAQGASYCHGASIITGKKTKHAFIVAENAPPYDSRLMIAGDQTLQTGLLKYRQMLNRYAECVKTNQWPGYPDKATVFETADYAHERDYAD